MVAGKRMNNAQCLSQTEIFRREKFRERGLLFLQNWRKQNHAFAQARPNLRVSAQPHGNFVGTTNFVNYILNPVLRRN